MWGPMGAVRHHSPHPSTSCGRTNGATTSIQRRQTTYSTARIELCHGFVTGRLTAKPVTATDHSTLFFLSRTTTRPFRPCKHTIAMSTTAQYFSILFFLLFFFFLFSPPCIPRSMAWNRKPHHPGYIVAQASKGAVVAESCADERTIVHFQPLTSQLFGKQKGQK